MSTTFIARIAVGFEKSSHGWRKETTLLVRPQAGVGMSAGTRLRETVQL
ncbi:hypothetical protein [Plantactinospora soyae]|uniref:Uncharacterized protein n=1 Tax=Plantactinospora soyae TaxID=1544732 RepID=A0A927R0Z2_9ACTN|nr:hypothetical protein [Plantactinospora soyae]MBE1489163.1 hypothetical protein [Plantactinospora soyae]